MKSTFTFIFTIILFICCTKEETLQVTSVDNVSTIFYFKGKLNDTLIAKDLAWYSSRSDFQEWHTEIVDETRIGYQWHSDYFITQTKHYLPDYYDLLSGGLIQIRILDSTLLKSILGKTIRSNAYGDTLEINLSLGLNDKGYWKNNSVFDFRINSIKDTAIAYYSETRTAKFKAVSISIPKITLHQMDDPSKAKEIEDLEMRFPVIIWD